MFSHAALVPYTTDSATLHLWHLDTVSAPAVDSVPGGTDLTTLSGGATLNQPSFAGFGSALSTLDGGQNGVAAASKDAVLSAQPLVNGAGDNVVMSLANPTNGAFTFEAIVRIDFDPALNLAAASPGNGRGSSMQILCGEGDVDAERVFQWRLAPVGLGSGNTAVPRLEFINLGQGSGIQTVIASIPTSGPDAIVSNGWYHVAVTYDGNESLAENTAFFWTLLDTNRTGANLIGTGSLANDLANAASDFTIGNEGRANGGTTDNFVGLIDEVRISRVARGIYDFYFTSDSDSDGLPDSWEGIYFNSLAQGATNDFDNDTFDNLQEFQAASNPTNVLSTPLDTDADGLPDAWERSFFGALGQSAGADPDADGYTNLQEYQAGTHPNSASSNPGDTDVDGLPDAWELNYFGSLAPSGAGDFDGDDFTNLQEYQYGTNPNNAGSVPVGLVTNYVPVEDGNTNTSEFGFAGASAINTVSFIRSALMTVGNQQFVAYYGRHATDSTYTNNNRMVIARRTVGTNRWEVFRAPFVADDINDGHDVISFGIDGNGYMHTSWGMHANSFHYARSTTPVTGNQPIVFGPDSTMTGGENNVTYPQFLTLPNGDLLYIYREGTSGGGDTYINRYHLATQSWTNQQYSAGQKPFLKGAGWVPDYNGYPNMPCLDADGNLYFVWSWRYNNDSPAGESGYQTNHDFDYARSTNGGATWLRQNGSSYTLPITERGENGNNNSIAEKVLSIPEGYSLINQAGMCLDTNNRPVLATWWAPGTATNNFRRQYMVAYPDANGDWQTRQVSQRTNDPVGTKYSESFVRHLGRPAVVCDAAGRIIVLYRDNAGSNGLTIAHSLPFAMDPDRLVWTTVDLTTANLGNYEPVIDLARWERDNHLQILYQPSSGLGYTPPANTASEIGVLEWKAAAYFNHRPALQVSLTNSNQNVRLSWASQVGWDYRVQASSDLVGWNSLATIPGSGATLQYLPGNVPASQQFWRLEIREGGFGL
ncbi:MAG: BNR-4 repeat-containing protein [Akkermansiaceae bacterium]|nr:BNR-4 repeat-containing protein [Verrucomicrobiales bacterium]